MTTTTITTTPLVEADCPGCFHHAARPAERYQTVYWTIGAREFYGRAASHSVWFLMRCRCRHRWLWSSLGVDVTLREETASD